MERIIDILTKAAHIADIIAKFISALLGITRRDDYRPESQSDRSDQER